MIWTVKEGRYHRRRCGRELVAIIAIVIITKQKFETARFSRLELSPIARESRKYARWVASPLKKGEGGG
jgi:hypothetical protein